MNFTRLLLLLLFVFSAPQVNAGQPRTLLINQLKSGDLIFQNLDCGSLCDAIEAVTPAYDGEHFSHVGIIYLNKEGQLMVIEAIGKGVCLTPIQKVLQRSKNPCYIGRLRSSDSGMARQVIAFALKQEGQPYDDGFIYNNGKYYCSELVYDAFKAANHQEPFFSMQPMTYKMPGSNEIFPAWKQYFSKLHLTVPEGRPGCSPGGIASSGKLIMLLLQHAQK
ncbi:MAG TPA: YiiX/YebB-like N1pC/P60 family cysteine hydrolase [Edaphocola sp.]|nr:YiiX/YebB-like N1pC/P60 family cysteine hydrolase [Edaphocola sp.]